MILTALPLEAAAVRAHLPSPIRHDLPAGTIVEEAALPGTEYSVCLVCTGPGNGQAAVVAERVISWADPAAVLFVGVAGTLKDDIALGDVIAAIRGANYQGGKETAAGFRARLRAGQRSAWEALPTSGGIPAGIFDPEHIAARLAALLDLLLAVPAPLPARIVPVTAIEPAMLVTRGTVGVINPGGVPLRTSSQPIRTEAVEAVSADGLRRAVASVVGELAARLDQAFGDQRQ